MYSPSTKSKILENYWKLLNIQCPPLKTPSHCCDAPLIHKVPHTAACPSGAVRCTYRRGRCTNLQTSCTYDNSYFGGFNFTIKGMLGTGWQSAKMRYHFYVFSASEGCYTLKFSGLRHMPKDVPANSCCPWARLKAKICMYIYTYIYMHISFVHEGSRCESMKDLPNIRAHHYSHKSLQLSLWKGCFGIKI